MEALNKLEEAKLALLATLPRHNFEAVYDDKPGIVGWRCRCGLWSGRWIGDSCVGVEVDLPTDMRYDK
jgi:hypothetical protein